MSKYITTCDHNKDQIPNILTLMLLTRTYQYKILVTKIKIPHLWMISLVTQSFTLIQIEIYFDVSQEVSKKKDPGILYIYLWFLRKKGDGA